MMIGKKINRIKLITLCILLSGCMNKKPKTPEEILEERMPDESTCEVEVSVTHARSKEAMNEKRSIQRNRRRAPIRRKWAPSPVFRPSKYNQALAVHAPFDCSITHSDFEQQITLTPKNVQNGQAPVTINSVNLVNKSKVNANQGELLGYTDVAKSPIGNPLMNNGPTSNPIAPPPNLMPAYGMPVQNPAPVQNPMPAYQPYAYNGYVQNPNDAMTVQNPAPLYPPIPNPIQSQNLPN
jgi:hypothetical protein